MADEPKDQQPDDAERRFDEWMDREMTVVWDRVRHRAEHGDRECQLFVFDRLFGRTAK